jgi:hypothetical protein
MSISLHSDTPEGQTLAAASVAAAGGAAAMPPSPRWSTFMPRMHWPDFI